MLLSVEFVFRMIGMVVVGLLGWSFGGWAAEIPPFQPGQELLYRVVFALVGALAGLVLTPEQPQPQPVETVQEGGDDLIAAIENMSEEEIERLFMDQMRGQS